MPPMTEQCKILLLIKVNKLVMKPSAPLHRFSLNNPAVGYVRITCTIITVCTYHMYNYHCMFSSHLQLSHVSSITSHE